MSEGFRQVRGDGYDGVIALAGAWTPSPDQVAQLELALGKAIAEHPALGEGGASPARFKRQYTGQDVKGRRVIRIDLSSEPPADWPASGLPSVKGGGAAFGCAQYDVEARRITLLVPNAAK